VRSSTILRSWSSDGPGVAADHYAVDKVVLIILIGKPDTLVALIPGGDDVASLRAVCALSDGIAGKSTILDNNPAQVGPRQTAQFDSAVGGVHHCESAHIEVGRATDPHGEAGRISGGDVVDLRIRLPNKSQPEDALAAAPADVEPRSVFLYDEAKCIRCGLCAIRCPTSAITMERFQFEETAG
jgi:NAD-dependent dihydropyrimidine dehydrogenase PreA subunit